ncbi:MAG: type II secretion system GspH family protein [Actinobacteria bacterium]|jgi:type IV pilus assembly protein PilA|nr:type II secretion system GspH family protein [Actinomycetota bacterium]
MHGPGRRHHEGGFTLIELMVVVMIIAVLLAVAIPSFLGFMDRSRDSAAQATLSNAEKVATLVLVQEESFPSTAALLARLPAEEPRIAWLDHMVSSTGPRQVSIDEDAGGTELALATRSESGTCFYLRLQRNGPTIRHHVDGAAACIAHDFQDGAGAGW